MATQAQIQANRRNAQKSTGPKTEAGKARARCNALKHGERASILTPVMPQEDPKELAGRIQQWIDDWQPRNAIEEELVSRGARLSFLLQRLERAETAHLARRARSATAALAGASARRIEYVAELARKLLYHQGDRFAMQAGPPWPDNPAAFLRGLEETPEGCRWLLERWQQLRNLQTVGAAWTLADQHRFIRLQGKEGAEAINDPELNRIFLAWEVIADGIGLAYWKARHDSISLKDPGFGYHQVWREIAPRPAHAVEAQEVIDAVIAREIGRMEALVAEYDVLAAAEAAEIADRAAFDGTAEFDRLRRCQTARARELLRTIDVLMKLRAAPAGPAEPAAKSTEDDRGNGRPPKAPEACAEKTLIEPRSERPQPICPGEVRCHGMSVHPARREPISTGGLTVDAQCHHEVGARQTAVRKTGTPDERAGTSYWPPTGPD
jgi:hypothetical protein